MNEDSIRMFIIMEVNGKRIVVKVTEDDKCMSGEIFPSKDICINPSLRQ